jgi:hypothetical protein
VRIHDETVYRDLLPEDVLRAIAWRRLVANGVHFVLGVLAFLLPPWLSFVGPVFAWWSDRVPTLSGGEVTAIVGAVFLGVWLVVAGVYLVVVRSLRRSADRKATEAIAALQGSVAVAGPPIAAPAFDPTAAAATASPKPKQPGGRGDDPRAWPRPPRPVPRRMVLSLVGDALFPFAFAALPATFIIWLADWHEVAARSIYALQPTTEVQGVITTSTRFEDGMRTRGGAIPGVPMRYDARATDDATTVAQGWTTEGPKSTGRTGRPVTLRVPQWWTGQGAWIDGMRLQRADLQRQAPFIAALGLGGFVSAVLAILSLQHSRRTLRLLRSGEFAFAKVQRKTRITTKKRDFLRCTFAFTLDNGTTHTIDRDVSGEEGDHPLLDEIEEPLLVDPQDPARACLLGELPGNPRIAVETGRWEHREAGAFVGFATAVFVVVLNVGLVALAW